MNSNAKDIIKALKPPKQMKEDFEPGTQEQIWQVARKYESSWQELHTKFEWLIGMLLYDHSMKTNKSKKLLKKFLNRIARLISKELGETWSQRDLQNCMETYLTSSLLEIMVDRWIKNYDFLTNERLRPEFRAAREVLINKIMAKGW